MKPTNGQPDAAQVKQRRGRVYLRGSVWWVDFSRRGKRYRRPVESATNERQAWDALELLRTEARQGRRLDIEHARWPQLAQRFLAHHEAKGTRPRTLARWKQVLAHLEGFLGSERAEEVPERVTAYVALRRRQRAKPASIRLELSVLAQAFRVARLPRLDLPAIEVHNVEKVFFEAGEVRRVVEYLAPALGPVVWFGFFTGWRKASCLGLAWKDVDFAAGVVRMAPGIKGNDRGAVFPFGALPALADLLHEQRERTSALERATGSIVPWAFHRDGCRILDMDDAWRTACRKAGLAGRKFKALRNSAAMYLRRLGLSESDIMEMCGWKTRAMFQRYAIEDPSGLAERLRRALSGTTSAQPAIRESVGAIQ